MKTINIAPFIKEINVFDDPEFCCDKIEGIERPMPLNKCEWLRDNGSCRMFITSHPDNFLFFNSLMRYEKCQLCKSATQKYYENTRN